MRYLLYATSDPPRWRQLREYPNLPAALEALRSLEHQSGVQYLLAECDEADRNRVTRMWRSPSRAPLPPSQEKAAPYLWAYAGGALAQGDAPIRSGKWLLFVKREDVDEVWAKIVEALHQGRLGHAAKVATAYDNPLATRRNKHVICVYTRDHEDREDVFSVRAALRDLGFVGRIHYKTDEATTEGRYAAQGDTSIAKYSG